MENGSGPSDRVNGVCFYEKVSIRVDSGSIYSFNVSHLENGVLDFSKCVKTKRDGKKSDLEYYAYVSNETAEGFVKATRGMQRDELVSWGTLTLGDYRSRNFLESRGRIVYITSDDRVVISPLSGEKPVVKYVDPKGNPLPDDYKPQPKPKPKQPIGSPEVQGSVQGNGATKTQTSSSKSK